jgi:uncharacterized protein (TIGR03086 family)
MATRRSFPADGVSDISRLPRPATDPTVRADDGDRVPAMDEPDQLADLDAAIAGVERILARIRADQWELPTPCDGVDVRGMVNHLVTGNLAFVTLVTGTEPPVHDADHLGDDPFFAFRASADLLAAALRRPGVEARTYELPFGPVPGSELAGIRITECLGHGWDLARATGQPPVFSDNVAARGLALARRQLRSRSPGPFAPEQPVPDGAPAMDRLAAFLGRAV